MKYKISIWIIAIIALVSIVSAEQVIVNSADWEDTYSAIVASELTNQEYFYITNNSLDSNELAKRISMSDDINLIESVDKKLINNIGNFMEIAGYSVKRHIESDNLNYELATKVDTKNYIIVDSMFGYNAISVLPYAIKTNSYVFISNKENNDKIIEFLEARNPENVIVYGYVNYAMKSKLKRFTPEFIDTGSRTENNIELMNKFLKQSKTDQITITSGKFMERSLFTSKYPTLILDEKIDDKMTEFINQNKIKTGVVIGNEIIPVAKELRSGSDLQSIIVKYAQGTKTGSSFSSIGDLDLYPVSVLDNEVNISKIRYNTALKKLEVTFDNTGKSISFLSSSITIFADGEQIKGVGDNNSQLIDINKRSAFGYDVDLTNEVADNKKLSAKIITNFGPEYRALEKSIKKEFNDIEVVEIEDNSLFELSYVKYSRENNEITVKVKNKGTAGYAVADVIVTLIDEYGDEEKLVFRSKDPVFVKKYRSGKIELKAVLDPTKITNVDVRLQYGEKEDLLIKSETEDNVELHEGITSSIIGFFVGIDLFIALMTIFVIIIGLGAVSTPVLIQKRNEQLYPASQELVDYIENTISQGFTPDAVKKHLKNNNYPNAMIRNGFKQARI